MSNTSFGHHAYQALRDECENHGARIQEMTYGYTVSCTPGMSTTDWEQMRSQIEVTAHRHIIDSGDSMTVLKPSQTSQTTRE